jgi:signal transduction histidine kinase
VHGHHVRSRAVGDGARRSGGGRWSHLPLRRRVEVLVAVLLVLLVVEAAVVVLVAQRRDVHDRIADGATAVAVAAAGVAIGVGIGGFALLRRSLGRPVDALLERVDALADGQLDTPVPVAGPPELARVAGDIERMRQQLRDEVGRRVQLGLLDAQEDERRRLAGELHDDAVQVMTACSLRVQTLRRRLAGDPAAAMLAAIETDVGEAIGRLRRVMFEIYPPTLDDDGLAAAVMLWCAETFPTAVRWRVDGDAPDLDRPVRAVAYRLTREALLNVHRHAGAARVEIRIEQTGDAVLVDVVDDGVGFDASVRTVRAGHLGLLGARKVAESINGTFAVDSAPGSGTSVRIALPSR